MDKRPKKVVSLMAKYGSYTPLISGSNPLLPTADPALRVFEPSGTVALGFAFVKRAEHEKNLYL